jgi:diaminohydroxyphosphoribosylaminopyrimidine deaminase/5-amino-6-(5-phosphoribosylamino)uracil reductase
MPSAADSDFMRTALSLARRNLGQTWPNPAVGCVLVRTDLAPAPVVVGRGWTEAGGRPHAETQALMRAGELARGATAYVTLEPCSHHGQTGPCAEALTSAGIVRAIVAAEDPDPRVAGKGIELMRAAGVDVEVGIEQEAALRLNAGHVKRISQSLPFVTLKLATTLDGRIATHSGESQWITGEPARAMAHRLRAEHDAVLVGSGTALYDDPSLTCRLPGLTERSPVRVVADGRLRLSLTSKLATTTGETPTWVLTRPDSAAARRHAFADCGIDVIEVPPAADGNLDLRLALELLGARGITRVLAEGGSNLAAALLAGGLVDEMVWFRAPAALGSDGLAAIGRLGIAKLADLERFHRITVQSVGEDLVETYAVKA